MSCQPSGYTTLSTTRAQNSSSSRPGWSTSRVPLQRTKQSPFYYPCTKNPIVHKYLKHLNTLPDIPSTPSDIPQTWKTELLRLYQVVCSQSAKDDAGKEQLPIPPPGLAISKVLHSLSVPRQRMRFVLLWLCNRVPYAGRPCARCGTAISKTHLESCAVTSTDLKGSQPGKRIDTLLHRAVSQGHAPSALRAVKILTKEVTRAFPPLRSR